MNTRSALPAILLGLVGLLFLAGAIFYATTDTGLLASTVGRHDKHAIVSAGLAVLSFVAANFARPRKA
jgi:hypothetical protein